MTEEKARETLAHAHERLNAQEGFNADVIYIYDDIDWTGADVIVEDNDFTAEEVIAMHWWAKNKGNRTFTKLDATR